MKIVKIEDVEKTNRPEWKPLFEGGKVSSQMGFFSDVAKVLSVGIVTFEPGATTKFHTHDYEQVLYVLSGKGRVATDKEETIVMPGSFVFFAPGEKHAHGAPKDSQFVQLTISNAGQATATYKM